MKAVKFAWVYNQQHVEIYSTLQEAIYAAIYAAESGSESLHHIEFAGRVITNQSMEYKELEDEIWQRYKDSLKHERKYTHQVWVKNAKGEWCLWQSCSEEQIPALKREMVQAVDAKRIKVKRITK